MIIEIKQIILTEAKSFNVGPSLGQKFMKRVSDHIASKKEAIKKEIGALDKLQELRSKPGFGNIDIKPENPPISAHSNPSAPSAPSAPSIFKSNKIELRDKTNPYLPYLK